MSTDEREKRWMAYMDGQMSTSEALEFERSLSSREKDRLNGEVRLESAVCESLMGRECCPLALWNSLNEKMKKPAPVVMTRKYYWLSRGVSVLAATALVVFGATLYTDLAPNQNFAEASIIEIDNTNLVEFAKASEVPATVEAAQKFLDDNNIDLQFVSLPVPASGHVHKVEFLGACRSKCKEKGLVELRFSCCGKPAALLVARQGTPAAQKLKGAARCGSIQETRVTGDYVTAVACGHDSTGLIDMLQPRKSTLI